ncbi:hypothetical protein BsWGS_29222 [Bradybaena similaris]
MLMLNNNTDIKFAETYWSIICLPHFHPICNFLDITVTVNFTFLTITVTVNFTFLTTRVYYKHTVTVNFTFLTITVTVNFTFLTTTVYYKPTDCQLYFPHHQCLL